MTDTTSPALAPVAKQRTTYNILGVELSRETVSIIALALGLGLVIGAKIQRSTDRLTGCPDCERTREENLRAIRAGAAEFERRNRRGGGGGEPGGSEGVSASPPAPSPADPASVQSPEGGTFPYIPPERDPLDTGDLLEEPHAAGE